MQVNAPIITGVDRGRRCDLPTGLLDELLEASCEKCHVPLLVHRRPVAAARLGYRAMCKPCTLAAMPPSRDAERIRAEAVERASQAFSW